MPFVYELGQVWCPIKHYAQKYQERDAAIYHAYRGGGYIPILAELAEYFGLYYSRISRIVKKQERAKGKTPLPRERRTQHAESFGKSIDGQRLLDAYAAEITRRATPEL